MNHDGPWSWRSTRQKKRAQAPEERALIERISRAKQNASSKAARKRRQAKAAAIRKRNAAPIF